MGRQHVNTRNWICAIAAAAFLLGCASTDSTSSGPRMLRTKTCPAAMCDAIVTVDDSSGTPVVSMYYDVMKMKRGSNPTITWVLDAPDGYEFRQDSIAPHTGAAGGGKQTTTATQWTNQIRFLNVQTNRYRVKNANSTPGTLYYDVRVYKAGTAQSWLLDPAIMNDP